MEAYRRRIVYLVMKGDFVMINTRNDMADVMYKLLNPLKAYYSQGKALLKLGNTSAHYPDYTAYIEAFSRPLWALAPFLGGGSDDEEWTDIYRQGFINGTDPESDEYWGTCVPYDQKLVEMAAMAYTILLAYDKIFAPMTDKQKENLYNWLNEINKNPCYNCNWRFFHVIVNVGLKKAGAAYDAEGMEESLKYLESCYEGDGWYLDGKDGHADYYVSFAMQFYSVVYAIFMKDEDPERCARFLERAMVFGKEFVYWIAEDGSAVPHGRSQTYRFAQVSFYSACVMAGIEPLPLGVMKGIITRHLEYWMSKPIFDNAGILTIGYCYPNLQMSESYNAPGSPYWAMKIFACLALPEDHEFWKVTAEPLPKLDKLKALKKAKMIAQRNDDGDVVLLLAGSLLPHVHTRTEEKYSKFAYSSKYGFSIMRSPFTFGEAAPDSVLSFKVDEHIFVRRQIKSYTMGDDRIKTSWSPFTGINVETEIIATEKGHIRKHIIDSEYDCEAYDAGFAYPVDEDVADKVKLINGNGEEAVMYVDPNTNLMVSKTKIPVVKYVIKKGRNVIETEMVY